MDLIRFFDFWSLDKGTLPLSGCDEFAVADFYHYLEKTEFAEATRIGIWSSLSIFFETMNDIDGARSKNPFSVSPYRHQRRYDAKYIPESIAIQLDYVLAERQESDKRYVLFGGRILNMDEQMEQRLMKNLRAHRVRGGICSDITTCKSDMWNCLECKAFVADTEQTEYYREQIALWREKQVRFSAFPIICENAKRNAGLFESILKSIETDVQRNEANNT